MNATATRTESTEQERAALNTAGARLGLPAARPTMPTLTFWAEQMNNGTDWRYLAIVPDGRHTMSGSIYVRTGDTRTADRVAEIIHEFTACYGLASHIHINHTSTTPQGE